METFIKILLGTPKWVYMALLYLLVKGIRALWNTTMSLVRMTILPVIFLVWSLSSVATKYGYSWHLGLWAIPFVIGGVIGWFVLSRGIQIYKGTQEVSIKGSVYPLILYGIFFIVKYIAGATCSINSELCSRFLVWGTELIVSSFISGLFGGRVMNVWKRYFSNEQ